LPNRSSRRTSFSGVARHPYLFASTRYDVRDAVYGMVPLTAAAYATLDSRLMQRLKHIRQVPPAHLVYPGATHTRFSHSIGVYHLVRLALQHLTSIADLEPEACRAAMAAGLLHDLGHPPNSHLMEEISLGGARLHHGELSVLLIEEDPELQRLLTQQWEVDPALVTALLSGRSDPRLPPFLHSLVDGPMDMDKLDYLNRDAHHAGVPYGKVEVQRLIESLRVDDNTGRMVMAEEGVGTVESVVFAKYLMFRYVYWHHTARIATTMFNRAVTDCLLALGVTHLSVRDPLPRRLCMATDASLEPVLRAMLAEAGVEPPPSIELLQRTDDRRLFKRVVTLPCTGLAGAEALQQDTLRKREHERQWVERLNQRTERASGGLRDFDLLIDVPPTAKFAVDFDGVMLDGDPPRIVAWADAPQPSYLSQAAVSAIEHSIRFLQVVANPDCELDAAARATITALAEGLR